MSLRLESWVRTTPGSQWVEGGREDLAGEGDGLEIGAALDQRIDGFGGCFNELGMVALEKLSPEKRREVFEALFGSEAGCNFGLCRLPIGASDYALDWYSHDEHPGDYLMERFSIERDRRYLIPYIKEALALNPGIEFFASPWSPPTWMKRPAVYNSGRLRMEEEVLRAYALYFLKFVRAYREEGIEVSRLHLQNEPFADQKFPSCLWSADQFIVFIRDYIGPLFESEKEAAEIWLGTLNGPGQMSFGPGGIRLDSYDDYVDRILLDGGARRHIRGVGYQWAGRADIQRTHESWPELGIMQTENECGDGGNGWDYAFYVFNLMRHYFANGACSYAYWNMVLEPGGLSTWGWPQNSMITIDPEKGDAILNPEYYVMKHYSRFVKGGARRRATTGRWSGSSTAFENPDGTLVLVTGNLQPSARTMAVAEGGKRVASLCLAPRSINTIVFAY